MICFFPVCFQDQLATEMFTLVSREGELSEMLLHVSHAASLQEKSVTVV